MVTEKQERTVIHLEIDAEHHYYGSVRVLYNHFGKEKISIGYKSLANFGIVPDKPYLNKYCTIRKVFLLTVPKAKLATLDNADKYFFTHRSPTIQYILYL